MNKKVKRIAQTGMLIALAMVLSYVEAMLPVIMAVPGVKMGLTNIVVLFSLYQIDEKNALAINIIRILLTGFLFGNGVSILYSLSGGILSFVVMLLLKHFSFSKISVSVAGGVSHNVGQILMAMLLLKTTAVAWYLFVLWFAGIAAGIVVGILSMAVMASTARLKI